MTFEGEEYVVLARVKDRVCEQFVTFIQYTPCVRLPKRTHQAVNKTASSIVAYIVHAVLVYTSYDRNQSSTGTSSEPHKKAGKL